LKTTASILYIKLPLLNAHVSAKKAKFITEFFAVFFGATLSGMTKLLCCSKQDKTKGF